MFDTELLERAVQMWHVCGSEFPQMAREYSESEQLDRERHLDRFLKSIEAELLRLAAHQGGPVSGA